MMARLGNRLYALVIIVFSASGFNSNLSAEEQSYSGFIGKSLDEYDGIVSVNSDIRVTFSEREANFIFQFAPDQIRPPIICSGYCRIIKKES
jgi:hypothetical protein